MQGATLAHCAECLKSMAKAKDELLTRIACANCQFAEQELTLSAKLEHERYLRVGCFARCPECGKWCWSRNSLAVHRELHVNE